MRAPLGIRSMMSLATATTVLVAAGTWGCGGRRAATADSVLARHVSIASRRSV